MILKVRFGANTNKVFALTNPREHQLLACTFHRIHHCGDFCGKIKYVGKCKSTSNVIHFGFYFNRLGKDSHSLCAALCLVAHLWFDLLFTGRFRLKIAETIPEVLLLSVSLHDTAM